MAWVSLTDIRSSHLSSEFRHLLAEPSSMTQQLKQSSSTGVQVKVLQHQWQSLDEAEAKYLNLPPVSRAIVREVVLYGDNQPWMYAVSYFPESVVAATGDMLEHLGSQPLGEVIFNREDLKRGEFEYTEIKDQDELDMIYQKSGLPKSIQPLWARRSIFYLGKHPLAVYEVFLPKLIEAVNGHA